MSAKHRPRLHDTDDDAREDVGAGRGEATERDEPGGRADGPGRAEPPHDASAEEPTAAELHRQVAEQRDLRLRALADMENVRRAARLDTEQARRYGASPVLAGLLEVLDNLQRALSQPPAGIDPDFLQGLAQIEQQFLSVLAAHGVSRVPSEPGTPFDPAVHRAILEQDSAEVEPGRILLTAMPGYRLHDRLLREAQVVVARRPE